MKGAHYYKIIGKEPATLLKYEFFHRSFSDLLFRFSEHLFFRTSLNDSEQYLKLLKSLEFM